MPKRSDKVTAENAFDSLLPSAKQVSESDLPRAKRVPEGDAQLTVIIPERIVKKLKMEAAAGSTLRIVVLKALQKAGYDVREEDLIDRRKPAGERRSEAYFAGKRAQQR